MPPRSMPQPMQQTVPQQMQFSSGAPVHPNNPVALEGYSEQQQQQQINHPNAMMNAGEQQLQELPGGQQQGLTVGLQQNHSNVTVAVLQELLYTLESPNSPQKDAKVLSILKQHPQLLASFIKHRKQRQEAQQQQQQQHQHHEKQQNIFQQLPPVSQMNAMSLEEKPSSESNDHFTSGNDAST